MKKHFPSLAAALLLVSIPTLRANIISGTLSGVITGVSGPVFPYAIGAPVSGNFRYDSDLLIGDLSGNFRTGFSDAWARFLVDIDGQAFAGWTALPNGLNFSVEANGFPLYGSAAGLWDLSINGGDLAFATFGDNHGQAHVTYTIPDSGTTFSLMGLVLVGLAVVKRLIR